VRRAPRGCDRPEQPILRDGALGDLRIVLAEACQRQQLAAAAGLNGTISQLGDSDVAGTLPVHVNSSGWATASFLSGKR
jgi:hypothetical protein